MKRADGRRGHHADQDRLRLNAAVPRRYHTVANAFENALGLFAIDRCVDCQHGIDVIGYQQHRESIQTVLKAELTKAAKAAALTPVAMKPVTGVGAPW